MDLLPPHLLLSILTKLTDTTDVTRCKLVSKTFNTLSQDLKFINLQCSISRYLKSRSPSTEFRTTPFKQIILNLVKNNPNIESISIGVDMSSGEISYDDVKDDDDDLSLSDPEFVKKWLVGVCDGLKSISISDFWISACWRKSNVLGLISCCCHTLVELELKNAWLSVDGLSPMPELKKLTLEFVRLLDDRDLNRLNNCFPSLHVLNLIRVGGLMNPKIRLLHLKECHWTVSNAPRSLAIFAPSLIKLKFNCSKPKSLVIESPLLSDFHLSLEKVGNLTLEAFPNLETFQLESPNLGSLIYTMPSETVKYLTVDLLKREVETRKLDPRFFDAFSSLNTLNIGPGAWFALETWCETNPYPLKCCRDIRVKNFKEIVARMVLHDVDITYSLISHILYEYTSLSYVALLIHHSVDPIIVCDLISRCMINYPQVQWRWGTWKEEKNDVWFSGGI